MSPKPILALTATALAALSFGLAACGSDNSARAPTPAATTAAPAPAAATAATPVSGTVVSVSLDEFTVKLPRSLKAGKYTFQARNTGKIVHMLMVEKAPVVMEAPNQPSEKEGVAMGETGDFKPGQIRRITVTLAPGTYVFFCNVPGHYAAGQHTTVTVTS